MPNIEAGIAALTALDAAVAASAPAAAEAPAAATEASVTPAAETPPGDALTPEVAAAAGLAAEPVAPPPPAIDVAAQERAQRQARLDEQLRVLRESKKAKLTAKVQKKTEVQTTTARDQELASKISAFEANPVQYLMDNGKDAASLMKELATAARDANTPEAKIAALEKNLAAKIEAAEKRAADLEAREKTREETDKAREAKRDDDAKKAAYQAAYNQEMGEFEAFFTPDAFPFARAYLEDPRELREAVRLTATRLAAGRRGAPVPFKDIASDMEKSAKAHAEAALKKLAPLLQSAPGAVKSGPQAASAPKAKGATTLSNEIVSQTASNRSRRLSERERQAAAVRQLEAADSK